jgi:ACS family tartrate transporter-like MFS transporter
MQLRSERGALVISNAVEKSAMRKIYLRLLPFAVLAYILAYVDRINISFAALTMRGDLNMSASAFGFAAGMFFWGYFIFEVPRPSDFGSYSWKQD